MDEIPQKLSNACSIFAPYSVGELARANNIDGCSDYSVLASNLTELVDTVYRGKHELNGSRPQRM